MQMEKTHPPCLLSLYNFMLYLITSSASSSPSSSYLRGVHPLDFKHFDSKLIKCKDGSNSFTKDRLNDDFCDCVDGTDEPGTSACPGGKFYCRNLGSRPHFLFSSRVNDHICDCCDGSDEYDGMIYCPNTCIMRGSIQYKTEIHQASNIIQEKGSKPNGRFDMIQNLKDLKESEIRSRETFEAVDASFGVLAKWLTPRIRGAAVQGTVTVLYLLLIMLKTKKGYTAATK